MKLLMLFLWVSQPYPPTELQPDAFECVLGGQLTRIPINRDSSNNVRLYVESPTKPSCRPMFGIPNGTPIPMFPGPWNALSAPVVRIVK